MRTTAPTEEERAQLRAQKEAEKKAKAEAQAEAQAAAGPTAAELKSRQADAAAVTPSAVASSSTSAVS